MVENYEVFAIRYATREGTRGDHFYGGDPTHDSPMRMDYFVWLIRNKARTIVVDTGCTEEVAIRRGRTYLRSPADGLAMLGVDASAVEHVILTHLHYDHAGSLPEFPNAQFIVQDAEIAFWTGRYASRIGFRATIEPVDIMHLIGRNFEGRIRFVDNAEEIFPSVFVHRVGGHSPGLQMVQVATATGMVLLAADASHYYENLETDRPFTIVSDLPLMYGAFDTIRRLSPDLGGVIPGHDPLVMERYPPVDDDLQGIAVRIA